MARIHQLYDKNDSIAIVGWSCRFPGAGSPAKLWNLLMEGRCAVSQVPADRFSLQRYGHPRLHERGKSYTWAAGIVDDVWDFDPGVFGISPREAEQMDPQQRILLELTWEALEDAGIRPTAIAGRDIGVFVGASQTDYAHTVFADQAIADAHFATGNALAILANRISYIFDLRGPSVTIDTACSSSLVALHQAVEALRAGRVDTAIVGGINVIASPAEFVSFSQASMLSPTGLCHAFSADADGYVRSEGGAVLVLQSPARAVASKNRIHGLVLASDVNSDGRTNGISLPSGDAQAALLKRIYSRSGIDPDRLAFVEAHGTGTPVGDPIEAGALGRSLGQSRFAPLPIGSIKTNIGHTEAASGLAGLMKALLALQHGVLPRSLHCAELNPAIGFADLNLQVCVEPLVLPNPAECYAGVNSFGFGGTNAHVVIAGAERPLQESEWRSGGNTGFFSLSAASKPALIGLAQKYTDHLARLSDRESAIVASAAAHRRDQLTSRLVITSTRRHQVTDALNAFIAGSEDARIISGTSLGEALPVGFVYSGNGSQWPGMGISAHRHNAAFRTQFEAVDELFVKLSGWSLREALFDEQLAERLRATSVAQPLIFAIQSALTAALRRGGLRPAAVLGHSVGEVAAAEASGALDLRTAVEVIYFRSKHQEAVRGGGRMAAILSSQDEAEYLARDVIGIEIAAINSLRATTVAGSVEALAVLKKVAASRAIPLLDLDLDYPFHTAAMTTIRARLTEDLRDIVPRDASMQFISTVTGAPLPGSRLSADYWWRNVREPVQFMAGIREAAKLGVRFFVEIGPRSTLLRHITDNVPSESGECVALSVLERVDHDRDPVEKVVAKAFVSGANLDMTELFGPDPGAAVELPSYAWQQRKFRYSSTSEAEGLETERHPFSGARGNGDALTWHAHIDTALFPDLADHRIGEQVFFPGTGFLEIVFAVAREWLAGKQVLITDFEIRNPLDLTNGETREVMSRVSPNSNTIEIFSRVRLSQAGWVLHCRCKMFHGDAQGLPPRLEGRRVVRHFSGEAIYRLGDACGLQYGPAFRLLREAVLYEGDVIAAELATEGAKSDFVLDPVRLDGCCHGLLAVFQQLHAEERGVSYIPVRFEDATLFVPGAVPKRAIIEVLSKGDRSIVANCTFLGPRDELIAVLHSVYCQAVQIRRSGALEATTFIELPQLIDGEILGESGPAIGIKAIVAEARAAGLLSEASSPADEAAFLVEGCAMAALYEIAAALADDLVIDVNGLVGGGRVPVELREWLGRLLLSLEAAGLARKAGDRWIVIADTPLPSAASLVNELVRKHPAHAAEAMIGAALCSLVAHVTSRRAILIPPESILSPTVLDFYDVASLPLQKTSDMVMQLLRIEAIWPKDRALRVLQLGYGPLTQSLISLQHRKDFLLTVFEPDHRRLDTAMRAVPGHNNLVLAGQQDAEGLGDFDLIVAAEGLSRLPAAMSLSVLHQALAPRGTLIAVEPGPSTFRTTICGLDPSFFERASAEHVLSRLWPSDEWPAALGRAGFDNAEAHAVNCGLGVSSLIVAGASSETFDLDSEPSEAAATERRRFALILAAPTEPDMTLGSLLVQHLRRASIDATVTHSVEFSDPAPDVLIHILGSSNPQQLEPMEWLIARCMEIKSCAERFGSTPAVIWHVHHGALASEAARIDPVATGTWGFSRTIANEFPHLQVRRVDIVPRVSSASAAARLRDIVCSGTTETELQIDGPSIRAVRVDRIKRALDGMARPPVPAIRLERRTSAGQRFQWEASERTPPGPTEIEIAVETTGLNFRDLMWILSLLSDDILEDGGAGPLLGCECAGRVARVGSSVEGFRVGDRVLAFAPAAFATHVTVAAAYAAKMPSAMSYEAAATIPVAFLTAYYSLVSLAKLKRSEWVLIHGGAGGVGMAAIQIARSRRAHVIATAGSPAKRQLLKILGVDYVLDSRSHTFVDDVHAIKPAGVDVVLNSLAGEAMERGIACLRPFGRFMEIGKRDYIANTHVGLRPFRKNLAYFGVDVDQLMTGKSNIGRGIYSKLMKAFESGALTPLPHTVFKAGDLAEAFHLMQHSGHIGKIVVQRPELDMASAPNRPFTVNPSGTHVITGGFGGFGLEAAKWLVERGARHLALLGRSGGASEEGRTALAEFAKLGVRVYAEPCDMADRRAVQRTFEHINHTMPPVVGVLHAAMVLDDGLIANLDRERFVRVLGPKVRGTEILDQITRGMPLDYFVLFSSSTTLVGNPGQGNYVAANAYMEGIARRRRQEGLKALAIGWGPITDVGVLARSDRLRARFQKLTGIRGMKASDALDLMARALEQPSSANLAVMTISPTEGIFTADRLPVLSSPTYANLVRGEHGDAERSTRTVNLYELAKSEGLESVRRTLTDIIVVQLARILHAREEEIPRIRPLGEIGVDSLMAIEVAMNLEEVCGFHLSLTSSIGNLTVAGLANEMISQLGIDDAQETSIARSLAERHVEAVDPQQIAILEEIVGEPRRGAQL